MKSRFFHCVVKLVKGRGTAFGGGGIPSQHSSPRYRSGLRNVRGPRRVVGFICLGRIVCVRFIGFIFVRGRGETRFRGRNVPTYKNPTLFVVFTTHIYINLPLHNVLPFRPLQTPKPLFGWVYCENDTSKTAPCCTPMKKQTNEVKFFTV